MKSKNNKNILKTLGIVLAAVVFSFLVLYLTNSNIVEGMKTKNIREGKKNGVSDKVSNLQDSLNKVLEENPKKIEESTN